MIQCGAVWKLQTPTLGLFSIEHDRIPIPLPAGAAVTILNIACGSPFVEVEWEQKHVFIFAVDLQARGEQVSIDTE